VIFIVIFIVNSMIQITKTRQEGLERETNGLGCLGCHAQSFPCVHNVCGVSSGVSSAEVD